jgi:putative endonuclease
MGGDPARGSERVPAGPRGRTGAAAEAAVAAHLEADGWRIIGRNVRVGRDELDLLACEPVDEGLVIVEVRSRSGPGYGAAIESVDRRKVVRLYRAASSLCRSGHPDVPAGLLHRPPRIDLVCVCRTPGGSWVIEQHLRGLSPS